ncbi:MAG TPA: DNA-processing protein DprA [Ideonella sp.]|nr:DNA-processing protein DprA [Ideonella sp.]
MERDELEAWLRLAETPGVGRAPARRLLAALASPEAVLAASPAALRQIAGDEAAAALAAAPAGFAERLDATWRWLGADDGGARAALVLGDPRYPKALLETADPPLLLYVQGRIELLDAPSLAIVGSRNPTPQGLDSARAFAAHLSAAGLTIVSGLALGIDGAAHEGALRGTGSTIAVIGTGPDRVYPKRHLDLARRIARDGAVVSEFPLGTPALPLNFPQRNRIIAGLAQGTLVVEAALQSGSLITARLAAEAGREVFAVPGSIHSPQSRGCHALIKQGAKLVESAADIQDELGYASTRPGAAAASTPPKADPLLDALGHDPVSLDALVARTGWPPDILNAKLLELELAGSVARLPGQLFQRRVAA